MLSHCTRGNRLALTLLAALATGAVLASCDRGPISEAQSVETIHRPTPYSGLPTAKLGESCEEHSGPQCESGLCLATGRAGLTSYV